MTLTLAAPPAVAADLVLARMLLPSPQPAKIRADVGSLLAGRKWTADEFAAVEQELLDAGLVTKRRNSLSLTEAGRARALSFLRVSEVSPRSTWGAVEKKYLFPRLVGLSPQAAEQLGTGDKLAAYLVRRKYALPAVSGTTPNQVLEALACRRLGYPEETTLDGLLSRVLSDLIESGERLTKEQLARQVPLHGTDLKKVEAAPIRRWLIRSALAGAVPQVRAEPEPPAEFDLPAFAETVRALVRTSPPEDRFHDNKVFIAAVWRASQREPGFPRLTLPEFKARLVEANRDGLLRLSRADLVQAMDPARVAESETTYLNATFHFVLIERDQP